jgi:hypothetical protein
MIECDERTHKYLCVHDHRELRWISQGYATLRCCLRKQGDMESGELAAIATARCLRANDMVTMMAAGQTKTAKGKLT